MTKKNHDPTSPLLYIKRTTRYVREHVLENIRLQKGKYFNEVNKEVRAVTNYGYT